MGDEFGSSELQELQKIRFLLESILTLKEEQARNEWRSAEPSPAMAGTHADPHDFSCCHGFGCDCDNPLQDTFVKMPPISERKARLIMEPPKADTAEPRSGEAASESPVSSEHSTKVENADPPALWCPRCRRRLYHGKAHLHTPNREA